MIDQWMYLPPLKTIAASGAQDVTLCLPIGIYVVAPSCGAIAGLPEGLIFCFSGFWVEALGLG
jgi:hypothetical protein